MSPSSHLRLVEPPAPRHETLGEKLHRARQAQAAWARKPVARRLKTIRELRHRIAESTDLLIEAVGSGRRTVQEHPYPRSRAETLASEILPLADACRFLETEAEKLLRPRALGRRGRPFWLRGSNVELLREPWGVVLILGPANYPLLLPGVQLLQALTAGNSVLLKPGKGGLPAAEALVELLDRSGLPAGLSAVLDESPHTGVVASSAGVDKVVLTGSLETGQAVLRQLAPSVTPATVELSGCDPVFVLDDADLDLATRALAFGLRWNGGFTCIAPRRVFVMEKRAADLEDKLLLKLRNAEPISLGAETTRRVQRLVESALAGGARLLVGEIPRGRWMRPLVVADTTPEMAISHTDVAAPLLSLSAVRDADDAVQRAAKCPYQLGATVFGRTGAQELAQKISAGVVVVNDLIVPTADPRVPFGGRRASGFGITRGAEGLLEMTRVKAICQRAGRFRPHFEPADSSQERLLSAFVQISHARTFSQKLRACFDIVKTLTRRPGPAEFRGEHASQ